MATASVRALRERADMADTIISNLRQQVTFMRQAWAEKAAEKLRDENATMRDEVKRLKTELCLAEIRNGVRQYYVPANIAVVASPNKALSDAKATTEAKQKPATDAPCDESSSATEKGGKSTESVPKTDKANKKCKPAAKTESEKMDVSRLDLRVGRIVGVERHPDADTLYVETVDIGEAEPRTVVSGLVKHVPQEHMEKRMAVFACNLKPAKVRGILSQAMIMCATSADKATVEILDVPEGAVVGDRVTVKEYPGVADAQLNPKKKIWEQIKPDLLTNAEHVATYKGAPCIIEGKGHISAKSVANGQIS